MKVKIYFKRPTSSRSAANMVLKELGIINADLIHRDGVTQLIAVEVFTELTIELIEKNEKVAFAEEVK